jgi:hypothetical protein
VNLEAPVEREPAPPLSPADSHDGASAGNFLGWIARLGSLAALLTACSGSDDGREPSSAADGPLYVVFSTIDTPDDSRIGYFATTPSIEGDVPIDVTRGIEEPGGGRLYVEPGVGTFMMGGGETPTITRYEVGADGSLARAQVLSFANQGVSSLSDNAVIFVSPSKAYFRDRAQVQLIIFDPTRMEIQGTLPMDGVIRDGFDVADFGTTIKRSDGIYFTVEHTRLEEWGAVPGDAVLVRVDPATDEITISADPRCTSLRLGMLSEAGDAYWFSDRGNTFGWRSEPPRTGARRDCALRVRAGETTFDRTWELDVTTRTNGWPAIAVAPLGGSRVLLRVLEESSVAIPPVVDTDMLEGILAWQWYVLDLDGPAPAIRNPDRPLGSYYSYAFELEGRTFITENTVDYSEATLFDVTDSGFTEKWTAAGILRGLARLR